MSMLSTDGSPALLFCGLFSVLVSQITSLTITSLLTCGKIYLLASLKHCMYLILTISEENVQRLRQKPKRPIYHVLWPTAFPANIIRNSSTNH